MRALLSSSLLVVVASFAEGQQAAIPTAGQGSIVGDRAHQLPGVRGGLHLGATNLLDNKVPMFAGVPDMGRLVMTWLQLTF